MPDCVLIDTSSLLFGIEKGMDLFEIIRFDMPGTQVVVPRPVLRELEGMQTERGKRGMHARIALELIEKNSKTVAESNENADDAILAISSEMGCAVVTNDSELRKRLRAKNVRVFTLAMDKKLRA